MLKVEHKDSLLVSNLIELPKLSSKGGAKGSKGASGGGGRSSGGGDEGDSPCVLLALTPISHLQQLDIQPSSNVCVVVVLLPLFCVVPVNCCLFLFCCLWFHYVACFLYAACCVFCTCFLL